jgi:tetratricopeptide (TPR) repeat protein
MPDNKNAAAFEMLIEKLEDRQTLFSMKYTILAEMTELADAAEKDGAEPIDTLGSYLYIGRHYYTLGHYIFALASHGKAMALLSKCGNIIADDADLTEHIHKGFVNMLEMYRKMKNPQAEEQLLTLIKKVTPDSFEAIRNGKGSPLKIDPVQYTERYMAILPELEAKIDAELEAEFGTATNGRGRGHARWHKKAEILKRDYGIKWKTLAELNPRVRFD